MSSFKAEPTRAKTLGKIAATTLMTSFLALSSAAVLAPAQAAEDTSGTVRPMTEDTMTEQVKEDARSVGEKIGDTAEAAGDKIRDAAKAAGEELSEATEAAKEKLASMTEDKSDAAANPPMEQLAALGTPGPLHKVTKDEAYSFTETWTGPANAKIDAFLDKHIKNGEDDLADIDGLLADERGAVVAVIADPEGFLNLNVGTQEVVLPLKHITYEPTQDAFQTDLTMDDLKSLPAWDK